MPSSKNENQDAEENVWQSLLARALEKHERLGESTLIVLGDARSGKRSLVNKLSTLANFENAKHSEEEALGNIALNYTFFSARPLHGHEDLPDADFNSEDKVNVWIIDDEPIADKLLRICLPSSLEALQRCVVLLCVDLACPWKIIDSMRRWISILHEAISAIAPSAQAEASLKQRMEERLQASISLKPGLLQKNVGLPLVVAGCKSDHFSGASSSVDLEMRVEFIQRHLRQLCFEHGAALVYTSAKEDINCRLLFNVLLQEIYHPKFAEITSDARPNLLNADAVFVPPGWDSIELIQGLAPASEAAEGEAKKKPGIAMGLDTPFEEVIRPPKTREIDAEVSAEGKGEEALDEQGFYKRLLAKQAQLPDQAHLSSTDAASAALKVFNASATGGDLSASVSVSAQRGGRSLTAADLLASSSKGDAARSGSFSSKIGTRLVTAKDAKENPELIANFFQSLLTRDKPNFSAGKASKE